MIKLPDSHPISKLILGDNDVSLLRGVIDQTVDAVICADQTGHILLFNPAAESMFGYQSAEAIGQSINILMTPNDASCHDLYLERFFRADGFRIESSGREVIAQRRNGETFPVHIALSVLTVQGHQVFSAIIRDISKAKETEDISFER